MKNKWSLLCLVITVAVVLVGLYSINTQAENYTGTRQSLFLHLGYTFTFSTAMLFAAAGFHFRTKVKG